MEPIRSFSSNFMKDVIEWRGEGRCSTGKVVVSELLYTAVVISAVAETVFFSSLCCINEIQVKIFGMPNREFSKKLQSSSFTVLWAVCNLLFPKGAKSKDESEVRTTIGAPYIYRDVDRAYLAARLLQPMREFLRHEALNFLQGLHLDIDQLRLLGHEALNLRQGLPLNLQRMREILGHEALNFPQELPLDIAQMFPWQPQPVDEGIVNEGAGFLYDYIVKDADGGFQEAFRECDPDIYLFVLVKSIWVFVQGPLANRSPLAAFTNATREGITALRTRLDRVSSLTTKAEFEKALEDESSTGALHSLAALASRELQGTFVKNCWQEAVRRMQPEQVRR